MSKIITSFPLESFFKEHIDWNLLEEIKKECEKIKGNGVYSIVVRVSNSASHRGLIASIYEYNNIDTEHSFRSIEKYRYDKAITFFEKHGLSYNVCIYDNADDYFFCENVKVDKLDLLPNNLLNYNGVIINDQHLVILQYKRN